MIFTICLAWMPDKRIRPWMADIRVVSKNRVNKDYGPESAKQGAGEKFPGLGRRGLPRKGCPNAVSAGWLLK